MSDVVKSYLRLWILRKSDLQAVDAFLPDRFFLDADLCCVSGPAGGRADRKLAAMIRAGLQCRNPHSANSAVILARGRLSGPLRNMRSMLRRWTGCRRLPAANVSEFRPTTSPRGDAEIFDSESITALHGS